MKVDLSIKGRKLPSVGRTWDMTRLDLALAVTLKDTSFGVALVTSSSLGQGMQVNLYPARQAGIQEKRAAEGHHEGDWARGL